MTIANIISVPVEKLEIVKIPGINTLKNRDNWWVAGYVEHRRKLTFTFRTPASSYTFKRKVYVLNAEAKEFSGISDPENPFSALDPEVPVSRILLQISLGDAEFHGSFDYLANTGELRAYSHAKEYVACGANDDYLLMQQEK